jgi:hypothetical protein
MSRSSHWTALEVDPRSLTRSGQPHGLAAVIEIDGRSHATHSTRSESGYVTRFLLSIVAIVAMLDAVGCATVSMKDATAPAALEAPSDLPDAARIDVALIEFDPGLPPEGEPVPEGVYPEIRRAEAKLLPIQLKKTLEQTGQWGTVSVLPVEPVGSDVTLTAKILQSDGRDLQLLVEVKDASGRIWFKQKYRTKAAEGSYGTGSRELDPHQPMFNTIANAMVEARAKLDAEQLEEIATISELQFADRLAPEVFDGYLTTHKDGRVEILRLPARDEPMLERVEAVRLRDEMFVDTMGIHYQNYATRLEPNYWHWREASSHEIFAKEALRREQIARGAASALTMVAIGLSGAFLSAPEAIAAAVAGAAIIQQQIQAIASLSEQREMHQEGLIELAESFQAEAQPMIVDLNSTNVRLTGTAAAQYEEWQRLLRDVYQAENSMISDVYMLPRQPTEEAWLGNNAIPLVTSRQDAETR